jgi:hypothetical protein
MEFRIFSGKYQRKIVHSLNKIKTVSNSTMGKKAVPRPKNRDKIVTVEALPFIFSGHVSVQYLTKDNFF